MPWTPAFDAIILVSLLLVTRYYIYLSMTWIMTEKLHYEKIKSNQITLVLGQRTSQSFGIKFTKWRFAMLRRHHKWETLSNILLKFLRTRVQCWHFPDWNFPDGDLPLQNFSHQDISLTEHFPNHNFFPSFCNFEGNVLLKLMVEIFHYICLGLLFY